MRMVLCTNSWSHHLGPVCRELANLLGQNFRMLISRPQMHPESIAREKNGWTIVPPNEPWIIGPPKTDEEWKTGHYNDMIYNADVALIGATSVYAARTIHRRIRGGKLTFFMGERLFKVPRRLRDYLNVHRLLSWTRLYLTYSHKNVHYLTMGHGCVEDLRFLHGCKGRIWRWGYLAAVSSVPFERPVRSKVRIGWCGRLIWWKKANLVLHAFSLLPSELKKRAEICFVGNGPEEASLRNLCNELNLNAFVSFHPFMAASDVRVWMRSVDVYAFTSNRMEGWGVVLGEAMDSACAVIANKEAGATLELVRDGVNGFVFENEDIVTLSQRMAQLIEDATLRKTLGHAAWASLQKWSPSVGAKRLLSLIDQIENNESPRTVDGGLCSLRG